MGAINPIKLGERFHRLVCLGHIKKSDYLFQCDCGKQMKSRAYSVRIGRTKSCGCYIKELQSKLKTKPDFIRFKNEIYKNYKGAAKRKGREFNLTKDEFNALIVSNCHYCNARPNNIPSKLNKISDNTFRYNGIDRVNNQIGYVLNNCVPCCTICNYGKDDLSYQEFQNWIDNLVKYKTKDGESK